MNNIRKAEHSAKVRPDIERTWIDEMAKCDFKLFKEFSTKVKLQGYS